ncbi:MAG: arsenate reductase ArsC [Rhodocyclaceae bacterium]|nr:arsenate reductase ArsC [Rhodocyclaceae bacterium]
MSDKTYNVLFICTGNSARSIMAESIMNYFGRGRFQAFSAGSHPVGEVNPFTLKALKRLKLPTDGYRSKNWDEFARPDAVPLDFVLTVCDNAAGEICPVWPGQPMSAHWGVADPAAVLVDDDKKLKAFMDTALILKRRIELFLALPIATIDKISLHKATREIGLS